MKEHENESFENKSEIIEEQEDNTEIKTESPESENDR